MWPLQRLAYWRRTAILRLAILFYQSIVGWIIIIGLCRTALMKTGFIAIKLEKFVDKYINLIVT
jgi:hypothetical protein